MNVYAMIKNIGNFPFLSRNRSSVVDYFLLKNDDHFDVLLPNEYSDHCALHVSIKTTRPAVEQTNQNKSSELYLKWDESLVQTFRTDLLNNISQLRLLTNNLEIARLVSQYKVSLPLCKTSHLKRSEKIGKYQQAYLINVNKTKTGLILNAMRHAGNLIEPETNMYGTEMIIMEIIIFLKNNSTIKLEINVRSNILRVSKLAKSDPKRFSQNINSQVKKIHKIQTV